MRPPHHPMEEARLAALREYGVLDTPRESDFDDLVALASQICGTPISLVSLVDRDRQWFKATVGVEAQETDIESSICAHAILGKGLLEVNDTKEDARFRDNPLVEGDPGLRFYAGVPLITPEGLPIGSLCVLDTTPRTLTDAQRQALSVLAQQVMTQLDLRRKVRELDAQRAETELARAAAEETVRQLGLVTDQLPTRVAYLDRDMRYRFVNGTYEREIGLTGDAILGMSISELLGEQVYETVQEHLLRALRGESHTAELDVPYPGGDRRIRVTYVPDLAPSGDVPGVVCYATDVTEEYGATQALRRSEEHFRSLFDAMGEGFCVIAMEFDEAGKATDYRFRQVNGVFEAMSGIREEDIRLGRSMKEMVPAHEEYWFETYGRVARTGESIRFENRAEALGRWFNVHAFRIGGEGSVEVGVLFADETQRRDTERAIQEERARQDRTLITAQVGTFDWDVQNDRVTGNALLSQLFGFGDLHTDHPVADYFAAIVPEDREATIAAITNSLATGSAFEMEYRVLDTEGRRRWVFARGDATIDALGKPARLQGVILDITDRKNAEDAQRESEELFRTVYEQAPDDAIVVMDLNRTVEGWNPAAERICGWTAEEAIGHPADMIFTPEDRALDVPLVETSKAARDGKANDERWHLRKDGSRFWGSGTMNSLYHQDGSVRGYLKVFRDATERYEETRTLAFLSRLADTLTRERGDLAIVGTSERLLGEHLGAARVAFAEASEDGHWVTVREEWSPGLPSMIGTRQIDEFAIAADDLRTGRAHVFSENDRHELFEKTGARAGISVPLLKEGLLAALLVVQDRVERDWTHGEIALVHQVADRMLAEAERARAEASLRTSEERFRQLVELSPSTVWFGEPDGGLSYISQDFYEATGLAVEDALPHGWAQVIHPEDLDRVKRDWEIARQSEARYDTEFRIRHRDGDYRWISSRALPLRDAEGAVHGWLGSNSDIQDRKSMEATLREMVEKRTEDLQRAVKESEGFNYSISHDLRTPLRAIASTASIVLEEAGPELSTYHRELLERQTYNANRLGVLIDELLRLSRLARVEVRRQTLNMSGLVRIVAEELETSCKVVVQDGMTAEGDPNLVRTVFQNLIGNACKFSHGKGRIWVGEEDGVFWVRDEGIGFDMKYAPKVFLPFERLVHENEFPGTGIGLANVKRIVERHAGRAWVESEAGKGTTFFFSLE